MSAAVRNGLPLDYRSDYAKIFTRRTSKAIAAKSELKLRTSVQPS
jgi:hypothetical protein